MEKIINFTLRLSAFVFIKAIKEFIETELTDFDRLLFIGDIYKNENEAKKTISDNEDYLKIIIAKILNNNLFEKSRSETFDQLTDQELKNLDELGVSLIKCLLKNKNEINKDLMEKTFLLMRENKTLKDLSVNIYSKEICKNFNILKPLYLNNKEVFINTFNDKLKQELIINEMVDADFLTEQDVLKFSEELFAYIFQKESKLN